MRKTISCWEAVVLSSNTSTTIVLWSFRFNEFLNSPFGIAARNMVVRSNKVETWLLHYPSFIFVPIRAVKTTLQSGYLDFVFGLCI